MRKEAGKPGEQHSPWHPGCGCSVASHCIVSPTVMHWAPSDSESQLILHFFRQLLCFSNKKVTRMPKYSDGWTLTLACFCSLALLLTVYETLGRWLISVCLSFLIYEMEKITASPSQGFVIIDRISDIYPKDWLLWHRKPDVFLCRSLGFSEGKSSGVWSWGRGAELLEWCHHTSEHH